VPANPSLVTDASLVVRTAGAADVEGILDLLEPQEFIKPFTRDQVRGLFTYAWADPKPDLGVILTAGERIVGFAGTLYSPSRTLNGRPIVTLNAGTLFIQAGHRVRRTSTGVIRYSEEIVRVVVSRGHPVLVFSARGPNDVVPKILLGYGFEEACSADLFFMAGSGGRTLWRPGGTVLTAPEAVRRLLTAEQLTIVRHHEPYGCRFYLVKEGDRHCFIVTKRRHYRGEWLWPSVSIARVRGRRFPVSDVLHISDPAVAVPSWGRLVAQASRLDGTVGLTCTASFLGSVAPTGTPFPQRLLVYGRSTPVESLDKLYTEQVVLQ
jgi:hypothetical protein